MDGSPNCHSLVLHYLQRQYEVGDMMACLVFTEHLRAPLQSVKKGEEDFRTFRKIMSDLLVDIKRRGEPPETDTTIAAHLLRIRDPSTGGSVVPSTQAWTQCQSKVARYVLCASYLIKQQSLKILHCEDIDYTADLLGSFHSHSELFYCSHVAHSLYQHDKYVARMILCPACLCFVSMWLDTIASRTVMLLSCAIHCHP